MRPLIDATLAATAATARWIAPLAAVVLCAGVLSGCMSSAAGHGDAATLEPASIGMPAGTPASTPAEWPAPTADPEPVPLLRLPPATLRRTLDLQQRIAVEYRDGAAGQGRAQRRELLAVLQADAHSTRLAAVAAGQVLARLEWDGQSLRVTRAPWAPRGLQPERILSDLQLSLWPVEAIAAALPPGWRLESMPQRRALWSPRRLEVEVEYPDSRTTVLRQFRDGYRLTITTLTEDTKG